jgi:tRNA (guanine-N7-)-methyltransferase
MGQKKLKRFAELAAFPNVLQYPADMAGNWNRFFGNDHPLVLELACGKGEYAVGLGRMQPGKNFIGMDVKGNRLWVGARQALTENLHNVGFLRSQIGMITGHFAKDEVSEIWITFPDPHLRASRSTKRLTHPEFLRKFQQIIGDGGYIHLKTDSPDLYLFTKKVIEMYGLPLKEDIPDVGALSSIPPELAIKTHYEGLDISGSRRIHYLRFGFSGGLAQERDGELQEWTKAQPILAIERR